MSLRLLAESDLSFIVEDSSSGFGWPITLTSPAGTKYNLVGLSNDIAQIIDPETGVPVSGRMASITLRISSLISAGASLPYGVPKANEKPWLAEFQDISLVGHRFKVKQSSPDRGMGLVNCILEFYEQVSNAYEPTLSDIPDLDQIPNLDWVMATGEYEPTLSGIPALDQTPNLNLVMAV